MKEPRLPVTETLPPTRNLLLAALPAADYERLFTGRRGSFIVHLPKAERYATSSLNNCVRNRTELCSEPEQAENIELRRTRRNPPGSQDRAP